MSLPPSSVAGGAGWRATVTGRTARLDPRSGGLITIKGTPRYCSREDREGSLKRVQKYVGDRSSGPVTSAGRGPLLQSAGGRPSSVQWVGFLGPGAHRHRHYEARRPAALQHARHSSVRQLTYSVLMLHMKQTGLLDRKTCTSAHSGCAASDRDSSHSSVPRTQPRFAFLGRTAVTARPRHGTRH